MTIIFLAALISTATSLFIASWVSFGLLIRAIPLMVSLSIGLLLGLALLHAMPEAFALQPDDSHTLLTIFLVGLLGFFTLEKLSLIRHNHHHEADGHAHQHGFDKQAAGQGGLLILVGDGLHQLIDGGLIATAFIADPSLGWITTLAICAHEVPQKVGDYIILLNAGFTRRRAIVFMLAAGVMALIGAGIAIWFLTAFTSALPYLLIITSAGFVYIALSDLIPQTNSHKGAWQQTATQLGLVLLGLAIVMLVSSWAHGDDAHHAHDTRSEHAQFFPAASRCA